MATWKTVTKLRTNPVSGAVAADGDVLINLDLVVKLEQRTDFTSITFSNSSNLKVSETAEVITNGL